MKKYIFLLALSALLFVQCQQTTTPVAPEQEITLGTMSMNLDMSNAPADVVFMQGILSNSNGDTIRFDFIIEENSARATVEDLQAGLWTLTVNAFNNQEIIIYTGNTDVYVQPGVVTPVYLHLNPTTGSLEIVVTWGDTPSPPMLLMALNSEGEWRVIFMTLNGTTFKDIIDGRYPIWTSEDRTKFTFLRYHDLLCEYDLTTGNIKEIGTLGVNANFLMYSYSLEKILFDYKYTSYDSSWSLAYINTNGTNFTTVLNDKFGGKYPVTPRNSDWIYYHTSRTGYRQIFRIKPDGSQNIQFLHDDYANEFPSFSFNGNKIVYSRWAVDSSYYALVIRDLQTDTEVVTDVTNLGKVTYPAFSPDGKYVVFSIILGPEHKDRQLFRVKTDGSELTQITFGSDYYWQARPVFW